MKLLHSISGLTLLSLLACGPAESQSVLTQEAKLPASFAAVSNVIELQDGRVLFADTRGKVLLRGDLASGKLDTLGTRVDTLAANAPAGQYKFPGWVAHLAGDTVAVVDFSAIRTTLWNEAGRPLGVLPVRDALGSTPILLYDTVGHGYKIDYQSILGGGEPGRAVRPDSVPVLRFTIKRGTVDTVALLAAPEYGEATFGDQVQEAAKVFAPNDFFGVLPDGTAWMARGRENRVDWRSPDGKWTRGKPHAYTRVPVTQADKDRVLAQVREHGKEFGMPQELKIVYPFADTKPPFEYALGRPNGEVWLQRPRAQDDAPMVYDVFTRKGAWDHQVSFPKGATLAGFGSKGAIYGAIKDADGRRRVGRFRLNPN